MGQSFVTRILLTLALTANAALAIEVNEIRIDQLGDDNDEYFELTGNSGESLDGLTYIVIGDGPGQSGVIEVLIPLDGFSIPHDRFFLVGDDTFSLNGVIPDLITPLNFENSDNVTHLLVRDFMFGFGLGDDLDSDPEDGILDVQPWGSVVDAVGFVETTDLSAAGSEFYYGQALGFSDYGPAPDGFVPSHLFRVSDGGSSWMMGLIDPIESEDTPGSSNTGQIIEPPLSVCDLDVDGDCDIVDIDSLTAVGNLVVGVTSGFDPKFDLTKDNRVNGDDLDSWLQLAGIKRGYSGPLMRGDANLDGRVNPSDLNAVGIHWQKTANWSGGDFNGDGIVDAGDLNLVGINWLKTVPGSAAGAAVPEPTGMTILPWLGLLVYLGRRRWL